MLAALTSALLFCSQSQKAPRHQSQALDPAEVSDYEGEKLSSAEDFRENSIKGPQRVSIEQYRLRVDGLVDSALVLTYDEVLSSFACYSRIVTLHCVEGWDAKILWEGVKVKDLLARAGVKPDARVVIFHAQDGYTSALPLYYLLDNDILLAFNMNNTRLRTERGFPFQLVAEDKWGYKWVKWVTRLEVSADSTYRGYWERRGYSNRANHGERFFER
jgi:DMSO/TMAO reductase YedYZ molybdopterin-dependent catalytic subunit